MATKKKNGRGAEGPEARSAEKAAALPAVRISAEKMTTVAIDELVPYAKNARTHSDAQIGLLRKSLRKFGFVTPILIDRENRVIAGHGRLMAAKAEGMTKVPCVLVSDLTDAQRRAYILADNRLTELGGWNAELRAIELRELGDAGFDVAVTGFELSELDPIEMDEPEEKPMGTIRAPKTCICPQCGCEFVPGKKD